MDLRETQRILHTALEGGEEEVGTLLERLRPRLVLWCASRMSNTLRANCDPEDAAQDILLAIHKDFRTFHGQGDRAFFGWLFTVAENKLRDLADYYGAKKRQRVDPVSFSQTSPSQAAARVEMVSRLEEAIASLPEDHRLVIQLYKLEGRETQEIAQVMGRTENAIRLLVFRSLKELRKALDGKPP